MIKADLVNRVAETSDVSRVKAAHAVEIIFAEMKNALSEGKRIEFRGFGVFQVRDRKRGVGRNPKTGEEIPITARRVVTFRPGQKLKARVEAYAGSVEQ